MAFLAVVLAAAGTMGDQVAGADAAPQPSSIYDGAHTATGGVLADDAPAAPFGDERDWHVHSFADIPLQLTKVITDEDSFPNDESICNDDECEDWPGGSEATRVDITQPDMAENVSGAVWNPIRQKLWIVSNYGYVWRMSCGGDCNVGSSWHVDTNGVEVAKWHIGGDTESITQAGWNDEGIYVGVEKVSTLDPRRLIREYDVGEPLGTVRLVHEWTLLEMSLGAPNVALEALTFVPDAWLETWEFVDQLDNPYTSSIFGTGGLFFAGHQATADIFVFDLNRNVSGTTPPQSLPYVFVGRYKTGESEIAGLEFDRSNGILYSYHNYGDEWGGGEPDVIAALSIKAERSGVVKSFPVLACWSGPRVHNNEGLALAANEECDSSGNRAFFLVTDGGGPNNSVGIYPLFPGDCNGNTIADSADITGGTSTDLNDNGIPDECEECTDAADCDDGVACTDDVCSNGSCTSVADDDDCADDGIFCNGRERCDAEAGCVSRGDPCDPGQVCDEDSDECLECGGDEDLDGRCDVTDNCTSVWNPAQRDRDGDGYGDACDRCFDADHDGDVDLDDWANFLLCVNGPDVPVDPICQDAYDADGDWRVDLNDLVQFQMSFGPSRGPDPGDWDLDHDVDLDDFAAFPDCLHGVARAVAPGCQVFDLDGDADIDLEDYGELQGLFYVPSSRFGDWDGDGDVDLDDFRTLADCLEGPGRSVSADCQVLDSDLDGDLDLADYGAFQLAFTPTSQ